MLLPVYTIVALINIFAKSQNFNFNIPKNLPYEIRVRRDLSVASKNADIISDVTNEKEVNVFQVFKSIKKDAPTNLVTGKEILKDQTKFVNSLYELYPKITDTVSKRNYNNIVPVTGDLDINYKKYHQNLKKNKENERNHEVKENKTSRENSKKYLRTANNLLTEETVAEDNQKKFRKSNIFKTINNRSMKKCTDPKDCSKRRKIKSNHLIVKIADKRSKRNFDSTGYNYNQNQNINNDPLQNYHVTEKSTFASAFNWVKNLVYTHEKYVITNETALSPSTNIYNASYAPYPSYNKRKNITVTPTYNWNNINNNNAQNYYPTTPRYTGNTGYNNNQQQNPYNGFNGYQNTNTGAVQSYYTTPSPTTPYYYGTNGYNYMNQNYPNNGYRNYSTGHINTGFYSTNGTRYNPNSYNNFNNNLNNSYPNFNNNYNNTVFDTGINNYNGYTPFSAPSETEFNPTTAGSTVVFEGCILCGSFGCPNDTRRVGFKCLPIKKG